MGQVNLNRRFGMQTRASDISNAQAFRQNLYAPSVFQAPYYPGSPYSLRGLGDQHGTIPGPPYCTDLSYAQLLAMFNVEDCSSYDAAGDVGGSAACAARNSPKLYGATNSVAWWQANCTENAGPQNTTITTAPVTPTGYSGPPIYAPGPGGTTIIDTGFGPAPTAATTIGTPSSSSNGAYNPVVSFQGSRAGSTFQPGDSWAIQISGGAPNTLVTVNGVHNGAAATNQMGSTDQNGNFSLSGVFDTSVIGNWSETWYVGTQTAGTFTFSVIAGLSTPAGTGTPAATNTPTGTQQQPTSYPSPSSSAGGTPTGTQQPAPSGGTTNNTPAATFTDFIPGISNTYLAIGAGALLLVLVAAGGK